jgi:hypothetical protein
VVDGVGVDVGEVVVQAHSQLDAALGEDDLRGRQPAELHLGQLVVLLQHVRHFLEHCADRGLGQRQHCAQQVEQRTVLVVLGEDGDCALGVVEGHVVDLQKTGIRLSVQLALPEVNPFFNAVSGLLCVQRLFPHADQLEGRNVQHLLQRACVVSAFNYFERDAVADAEHCRAGLRGQRLVFLA